MTRAHLYRPIQDNLGNIRTGAVVRVLDPATDQAIVEPLYAYETGPDTLTNPFTANSGVVDIYLDQPRRVKLGIRVGFEAEFFITLDVQLPIDVMPTHDHPHVHGAIQIPFTPPTTMLATDVQTALEELERDKANAFVRQTVSLTTSVLAASGGVFEGTIPLALSYRLYRIQTDRPARVRLYTRQDRLEVDRPRAAGTDPAPNSGSGLMLDFTTTAALLLADLAPLVDGVNLEATPTENIPISVTNNDTLSGTVTVTFIFIRTE